MTSASGVRPATAPDVPRIAELAEQKRQQRGAVQAVVVCGPQDEPKRSMLLDSGHIVASEWFTLPFAVGARPVDGVPVNDNFVELLFWIDAFKRASAASVTVIVPYFGYGKGDKKDEPLVEIIGEVAGRDAI